MAGRLRRVIRHPLRATLLAQLAAVLLTGALLVVLVAIDSGSAGSRGGWNLSPLFSAAWARGTVGNPQTFLLAALGPLALLAVASLVIGLVSGRWGLPGHVQGRAVFYVPLLAGAYFVGGWAVLAWVSTRDLGLAVREAVDSLASRPGLTLLVIYMSLSTAAVGVGWALALAVSETMRRRGCWETVRPAGDRV